MRKWRLVLGIVVTFMLAGCADTPGEMRPFVGKSDSQLLSAWGAPDRVAPMSDGNRVATYNRRNMDGGIICQRNFVIGSNNIVKSVSHNCPM